jgi:hypothetical protein
MGGPSRGTLTGHQSDFSSPPTKGKAHPMLQPAAIVTTQRIRTAKRCVKPTVPISAHNLRSGLTIAESLQ